MEEFVFGSWYVCWGVKPAHAEAADLPCEHLIAAE
jgi:hypothetical protein